MNQFLVAILAVVFLAISLSAFFLVFGMLFPSRIAKTHLILTDMFGRSFLVGLGNAAFFLAIALGIFALARSLRIEALGILSMILLAFLAIGIIFGLAGMVQLVSEKLFPQFSSLRRTVAGALTLGLACGLPFVGWFGLLPLVCILGLGAFITSFFYHPRPDDSLEPPVDTIPVVGETN